MASITLQMSKRGVITIPKSLRDSYGTQPGDTFTLLDLGGVFVLNPRRSEIDAIADKIAAQWAENGQIGTAGDFLEWFRERLVESEKEG